jgi:hypothetical protein
MSKTNPSENSAIKNMMGNLEIITKMLASNPALDNAIKQINVINSNIAIQTALGITQQFPSLTFGKTRGKTEKNGKKTL